MSSATHKCKNSDTPVKRIQLPQSDESSFKVKCGAKTALFFPLRLKKTGKGMSDNNQRRKREREREREREKIIPILSLKVGELEWFNPQICQH